MAAKVTAKDRKEHSATGDGRFPIATRAQASSALKLRGHAKNKEERRSIIRRAAKFLPGAAKKAWDADTAAGLI